MLLFKKIIFLFLVVFLTATCVSKSSNNQETSRKFSKELLQEALNKIEIITDYIEDDYVYLQRISNGISIIWENSSSPENLSGNGKVVRPGISQGDIEVKIDAIASSEGVSVVKTFNFTIAAKGASHESLVVEGIRINFNLVESGLFRGARITRPFYISEVEVDRRLYLKVMDKVDSFKGGMVTGMTWDEAMLFCEKLSDLSGKNFTLPTETQWFYSLSCGKLNSGILYNWTSEIYGDSYYSGENPFQQGFSGDDILIVSRVDRGFKNSLERSSDLGFSIVMQF